MRVLAYLVLYSSTGPAHPTYPSKCLTALPPDLCAHRIVRLLVGFVTIPSLGAVEAILKFTLSVRLPSAMKWLCCDITSRTDSTLVYHCRQSSNYVPNAK